MIVAESREVDLASRRWMGTWPLRYGFAVMLVAIATALELALRFLGPFHTAYILFYPTVVVIAMWAGFWPGIVGTLLATVSGSYFFIEPRNSFAVQTPEDLLGPILFSIIGVSLTALTCGRTRAQEALRNREEDLKRAQAVAHLGSWRYDLQNHILTFSDEACRIVGLSPSSAISPLQARDLIHPEDRERLDGLWAATLTSKTCDAETRLLMRGEVRWVRFQAQVECDAGGQLSKAVGTVQDITEQKESDRALRLFRMLIDQSNDAVEVVDPESMRFLDINEKACKELGYSREELLAMTVFDINPELNEAKREQLLQNLRDRGSFVKSGVHQRKDGSIFPVETSLSSVHLDRKYLVAVSRDISDRKRAEDALRASEDRYRDLVEHSEDLVCTHDLEGRLISVNPAPARLLGYEVAELLKIPMRELVPPEFREQFDAYLMRIGTRGIDKGFLTVMTRVGERRIWKYSNTLRTEGVATPIVRGMAHDVTEKRRAEAALCSSEKRYRMLFEKTVAGVAIISMVGEIVDCNDAWAWMFGYSDAMECRGSTVVNLYFDLADRELLLEELRKNGTVSNRELHLRRKDGKAIWILANDILLPETQDRPLIQATVIDISARKEAEEALRDAKKFSENLIQTASTIILGLDTDGNITLFNDAGEEITGYTFAELKGKNWDILVPRDRFPHVWAEHGRLVDGTAGKTFENPIVTKTGEERYIAWRNSTAKVNGKVVATISFGNDITERKQAEVALRESEAHFRILVEQASDGIFITDAQGNYLDANSAGTAMLGFTRGEILRCSIADVVAAEEHPRIAEELPRLLGGMTIRSEWKFQRKDGSFFPGEVCAKRLPDGRLQGILRDMTERKRAEETLRESEERFRVALKDSPISVFSQDRDLRYTWIYNPHLYWQKEIIGKSDEEILGAEHARSLVALKRRVLETGVGVREEVVIQQNGSKYYFDVTIEPLLDSERKVIGITAASMDIARLRELADRLRATKEKLAQEKLYLESEIETELGFEEIIGQNSSLREVLRQVRVVAPTDSTVLLLGETGTGKELVARSVHTLSPRHDQSFIKLNCAAVPSGLLESELFGHEKGAFTGAVNQKVGRLELADKGTLFLDEVGELPLDLQPKLLRVLQDREFERLGGVRTLKVDVRIISATNRDLYKDVTEKKFREDLFYRLNVFPLQLPPLRDRRSDIPLLVHHFLRKHAGRMGKVIETIPDDTIRVLQNWNWPGNIRELENMIERMVILTKGQILALPPLELDVPQGLAEDNLTEMEREHIIRILRETHGVLSGAEGAASRLGIKRTTLQSMLKRFDIELEDYRRGTGTFGPE